MGTKKEYNGNAAILDREEVDLLTEKQITVHKMGTVITLTIIHPDASRLLEQACEMINDFERRFSANDPDSDLMEINRNAGIKPVRADHDLFELIKIGKNAGISSNGALNIAIGALVKLWRIGFSDARLPGKEEIRQRLKLINPAEIELDEEKSTVFLRKKGMEIDLGAIAKGYFADRLKEFFQANGVKTGIINLGGNVLTIGCPEKHADGYWRVGIQNPFQPRGNLLAIVFAKDESIVTSGIYERTMEVNGKIYHHIFNSKTGYPLENDIASVTVVSDRSVDGEIWTTVLFAKYAKEGMNCLNMTGGIEGIIVTKDGDIFISNRLKERVVML